ncbi:Gfo/Idh/MocA family protein [Cerasicoccus maritimus]|uniref:Gfo/Idh/MocA family protein n=1 Tax=Cerasicoccus maritimus TaxID=490089 RepID=UPI00285272A2|nr:Gfo/Idh/MocA family oxidoreductase [Cerasicoccus maritimus]
MHELNWGIIGCGDVVEKKSGPSIALCPRSRISAVMRRAVAKLTPFADAYDVPLRTDDADEVLNCEDVNIVYIATPPSRHKDYVIAAAERGHHVLVEKPMGMTAEDSQAMIDACERAGVELFVAYYRRFHPHVAKMRELIAGGALGELIHGQAEYSMPYRPGKEHGWRVDPQVSGGGLFVDILAHRIDLMNDFLGDPAAMHGAMRRLHEDSLIEDLATMLVTYDGGGQAVFVGNFASQSFIDRFVLSGTLGEIRTDSLDSGKFTLRCKAGEENFACAPDVAPHVGLMRHIESVLLDGAPNETSGRDGLLTDRVLDAHRAS